MPAFKLKQRIFFSEFERGRKAHGYVPDSRLFPRDRSGKALFRKFRVGNKGLAITKFVENGVSGSISRRNKSNKPGSRLFPGRISRTSLIRRFLAQPPFQKKQPHRPQK